MKRETPAWLKRTQEGSWEPEILIAGIALVVLFQLPAKIHLGYEFIEDNTLTIFQFGNVDDAFFLLLETAVYWLIACLIVHLGLRSIWVSLVGLSYAFPEGINLKRLGLTTWFHNRLLRIPPYEDSVMRLEKISSVMYATAFLLMLTTVGISCYLIFWAGIISLFSALAPESIAIMPAVDTVILLIIIGVATPYLIDFLTIGWLKRTRFFTRFYRPIYIFMGYLTLAPLYRGLYYGLVSNLRRRYVIFGIIGFIIVTFFIVDALRGKFFFNKSELNSTPVGYTMFEGYYRDLNPEEPSRWATIQSSEIENGVIKIIFSHKAVFDNFIKSRCNLDEKIADRPDARSALILDCLADNVRLTIDSLPVKPTRWFFAVSPKSRQQGIGTWIRTDTISKGIHQLNVTVSNRYTEQHLVASIPFYNLSGKYFQDSDENVSIPGEGTVTDSIPMIKLPIKQDL